MHNLALKRAKLKCLLEENKPGKETRRIQQRDKKVRENGSRDPRQGRITHSPLSEDKLFPTSECTLWPHSS